MEGDIWTMFGKIGMWILALFVVLAVAGLALVPAQMLVGVVVISVICGLIAHYVDSMPRDKKFHYEEWLGVGMGLLLLAQAIYAGIKTRGPGWKHVFGGLGSLSMGLLVVAAIFFAMHTIRQRSVSEETAR